MKPCAGCQVYLDTKKECHRHAPMPKVEPRVDVDTAQAYWPTTDGTGCGERIDTEKKEG